MSFTSKLQSDQPEPVQPEPVQHKPVQPKTVLLTGGRAPVTLELARLFADAGDRVLVADSLRHQLCTCSQAVAKNFVVPAPRENTGENTAAYIAALQEIVQLEQVDWLIPTCEEIFYIAAGLAKLGPYCRVFVEPLEKLEPFHNKWTFIQKIQAMGLAAPETWLIQTEQDLRQLLKGVATPKHLVLKPVYSRFASQVKFVSKSGAETINIDLRPDKPWVAQAFITGTHYCLYGVAHQGQLTAFAAYPTTFTAGAGSCICFESVADPTLLAWMQRVVDAEQFTGQIAFDVIMAADGKLYPLECNPRAISAIHLFAPSDRLPQAFFSSETALIQPQSKSPAMITLAMLLYGLWSAIATRRLPAWTKTFLSAKDVIFQWRDPLPALHLGVTLLQFVGMALRQKQSLQRVSTQDIEWDGEPIDVS
ncbi:MAG: ATP-grasp domain-containing protein [Phormidesmis sp.]